MMCRIEGCNHTISRRMRIGFESNCWGLWGICPCCAFELTILNVITYDFKSHMKRCTDAIKEELKNPETPNRIKIMEIQNKKRLKQKNWIKENFQT